MSDVLKFRSLAELEEDAAAWVWRLDDEDVSPQLRAEFEQWLRRDPRHRRAFEELGGIWQSLDDLAEAKRDEKVATFVAEERRLYAKPAPGHGRLRRWLPWAMAASLSLAIGGLSWYQRGNESETIATAVGQQRSATLADGSQVRLNTNTILETHFTKGARVIRLEKGEASFKVAHNAERPFYVHAGDTVVRAVGTAFNVRLRDAHDVEVIVTEGVVEVTPQDHAAKRIVATASPAPATAVHRELTAGERFEAAAATPVERVTPATVSNALAWHDGAIVFDGVPLVQAIAELNRYTDTRLVVADASIDDLRVGGRFRTGDVDGFLEALTRAFPVTIRRTSDHLVYIHARESARPSHR
jgi:transmembrane sensor